MTRRPSPTPKRLAEHLVPRLWALLGWIALPFCAFFLLLRHGSRGDWRRLRQRLGWARRSELVGLEGRDLVWVHAVSAGEVQAAKPLAEQLRASDPRLAVWLSVGTSAGLEVAERLGLADSVGWLPLDAPPCCRLALSRLRPRLMVLLETEIWPNLVSACHRRGVPLVLANAHIDERSYRSYRRWRSLFAPVLGRYERLLAQSADDAEQLAGLGARRERLRVCGSLKVDAAPPGPDPAVRRQWRTLLGLAPTDLLLIGGSTHPGEEDLLVAVLNAAHRRGLPTCLLLAPRDTRRVPALARQLDRRGRDWGLRSALPRLAPTPEVVLLDTLGELSAVYAAADLVFVGKSLTVGGGQSPAEPAAWGCALVFGPAMQNFAPLAHALTAAGGARQVATPTELEEACLSLLGDSERRAVMGEQARRVIDEARGAAACSLAQIRPLLERARQQGHLERRTSATPRHKPRRD